MVLIHLISPGCPRPSIVLQCRIMALNTIYAYSHTHTHPPTPTHTVMVLNVLLFFSAHPICLCYWKTQLSGMHQFYQIPKINLFCIGSRWWCRDVGVGGRKIRKKEGIKKKGKWSERNGMNYQKGSGSKKWSRYKRKEPTEKWPKVKDSSYKVN